MKKIIIAPDSFKGTMSSIKAGKIIKKKLEQRYPYEFIALPVSDGGEGALSALKAQKKIKTRREWVTGPNFKKIKCMIGIYQKDTIVIESADIVGFKHKKKNSTPGRTTTLGIGELIYKYYRKGYKKFILCLGGTITNDGGCGILSALGVKFYNEREEEFVPVGDTLQEIKRITQPSPIKELDVTVLADVKNPLSGTTGASYVYAKQKGATDADVVRLDAGLRHFAEVSKKHLGFDYSMKPGSGAAGGIGFAIFSYLNGKYESGIDKILEMISFDSFLKGSSLLITGEGMLDRQSGYGKAISGIIKKANKEHIPVILIVGTLMLDAKDLPKTGADRIYAIKDKKYPLSVLKKTCVRDLKQVISKIKLEEIKKRTDKI